LGTQSIIDRFYNYALWITDGYVYFGVFDSVKGMINVKSNSKIKPNNWYHVAGVYDHEKGNFSLYINGVLENSTLEKVENFVSPNNYDLRIGNGYIVGDLASQFYGKIDEVRISNITRNYFRVSFSKFPYNFNLTTDGELVYATPCQTKAKNIAVNYKVASGYEIGKPVSGYVARAWAKKIKSKITQKVFDFNPLGSGWGGQPFSATKKFKLPTNISIKNGTLYLSIHYGKETGWPGLENIKINGVEKKGNCSIWLC
jgi:hypothetical protein